MNKRAQEAQNKGESTMAEWPVKRIHPPQKDDNGKYYCEVEWEPTKEKLYDVYHLADLVEKEGDYEGKSVDFIREDMFKKQLEEDGKAEDEIQDLEPTKWGEAEEKELSEGENHDNDDNSEVEQEQEQETDEETNEEEETNEKEQEKEKEKDPDWEEK